MQSDLQSGWRTKEEDASPRHPDVAAEKRQVQDGCTAVLQNKGHRSVEGEHSCHEAEQGANYLLHSACSSSDQSLLNFTG